MILDQFSQNGGLDIPSHNVNGRAYGYIINNHTAFWYYEVSTQRFIPPYTIGLQGPLPGVMVFSLLQQTPPGVQGAPFIAPIGSPQLIDVQLLDTELPTAGGTPDITGNAAGIATVIAGTGFFLATALPHAQTLRAHMITFPGLRFFAESFSGYIVRTGAASPAGFPRIWVQKLLSNGTTTIDLFSLVLDPNATVTQDNLGCTVSVLAGESLNFYSMDSSVGGSCQYNLWANVMSANADDSRT